jgi:hypothetical protein
VYLCVFNLRVEVSAGVCLWGVKNTLRWVEGGYFLLFLFLLFFVFLVSRCLVFLFCTFCWGCVVEGVIFGGGGDFESVGDYREG